MYDCLKDADALLLLTEWTQFRSPDFHKMLGLMKDRNIFDGRNVFNINDPNMDSFSYTGIGKRRLL